MRPSIPVSAFVDPPRGGREWRTVCRASRLRPRIDPIGQIEDERYFRVQGDGRDPHVVVIWPDKVSEELVATCNCEAHYVPMSPQPCYHLASVLIFLGAATDEER